MARDQFHWPQDAAQVRRELVELIGPELRYVIWMIADAPDARPILERLLDRFETAARIRCGALMWWDLCFEAFEGKAVDPLVKEFKPAHVEL